jgi:hypothetical protein
VDYTQFLDVFQDNFLLFIEKMLTNFKSDDIMALNVFLEDNMSNNQMDDLLSDIEEKRKQRMSETSFLETSNKNSLKKSDGWHQFKRGILMGLFALGTVSSVVYGVSYVCEKFEQNAILSEQAHVQEMIRRVNPEIKNQIRQDYDGELLLLINAFQAGEKTNGYKMSPRNAVFAAHSHLLYKYGAYNPNVKDEKKTMEDWILLDHMSYRYYQYRDMKLSNAIKDAKNPYTDMLRAELIEPSPQRVPVRYDNFFEGLKLNNIMKR